MALSEWLKKIAAIAVTKQDALGSHSIQVGEVRGNVTIIQMRCRCVGSSSCWQRTGFGDHCNHSASKQESSFMITSLHAIGGFLLVLACLTTSVDVLAQSKPVNASAPVLRADSLEPTLSPVTSKRLTSYRAGAIAGDYQAMRNLAFTWSTDATRENASAAMVGCAWYAQILVTHKSRANEGDKSNAETFCGRLSSDQLQDALSLRSRIGDRLAQVRAGQLKASSAQF